MRRVRLAMLALAVIATPVTAVPTTSDRPVKVLAAQTSAAATALRRAIPASLRRAFDVRERAWHAGLRRRCPTMATTCLAPLYLRRQGEFAAIDGRVSNSGPTITDLSAYTLVGQWRVVRLIDPDASEGRTPVEVSPLDRLPAIGTIVSGKPGEYCTSTCRSIGWRRQTLSSLESNAHDRLHLSPDTPVYIGHLYDRMALAVTLIAAADGHLLAEQDLCNADASACRTVWQDWQPIGTAAMVDLSH